MVPRFVFHRLRSTDPDEEQKVRTSGQLWGRAPRMVAGNGPACVKAFAGPLPEGDIGYTFATDTAPTRYRNFVGRRGAVWEFGTPGVVEITGGADCVAITVRILDAPA